MGERNFLLPFFYMVEQLGQTNQLSSVIRAWTTWQFSDTNSREKMEEHWFTWWWSFLVSGCIFLQGSASAKNYLSGCAWFMIEIRKKQEENPITDDYSCKNSPTRKPTITRDTPKWTPTPSDKRCMIWKLATKQETPNLNISHHTRSLWIESETSNMHIEMVQIHTHLCLRLFWCWLVWCRQAQTLPSERPQTVSSCHKPLYLNGFNEIHLAWGNQSTTFLI